MELQPNTQPITTFPEQTPLTGMGREVKMHKAAQGFVEVFFTQMMEQMFSEANESNESDEEGFQSEMYGSFLAEAMAEKVAASGMAKGMVAQIENMLRRQGGLEDLKGTATISHAHQAYKSSIENSMMKQEKSHVRATAA